MIALFNRFSLCVKRHRRQSVQMAAAAACGAWETCAWEMVLAGAAQVGLGPLAPVVSDSGFDGVFGEHGAVQLDGREAEL